MRNKICFSGKPNLSLCNIELRQTLELFVDYFNDNLTVTINITNMKDIGIELIGEIEIELINLITIIPNLQYFSINDKEIINHDMKELIAYKTILRSFKTFHQNDDIIRHSIHSYFSTISASRVLCIGGECYIYPYLIKDIQYFQLYTDNIDIYNTCIINHNKGQQIDYNFFELADIDFDIAILNVSIKGLTKYMANQLLKYNIKELYLVSCSPKSFNKDYQILKSKYIVDLVINNKNPEYNNSVQIYKLNIY